MASVDFPKGPLHKDVFKAPTTKAEYYWDKDKSSWIFRPEQANGGRVTVASIMPPVSESIDSDLWIDTNDYSLYVFDGEAGDEGAWIGLTNFGITASVYVSDVPPSYNQDGALWFDNTTGDLKVRYNDGGSKQWVALTGNGLNQAINGNFTDVQESFQVMDSRLQVLENNNFFRL